MAVQFFFARDLQEFGPFSPTVMRQMAAAGQILGSDLVWQEGEARRHPAVKVKNLFPVVPPAVAILSIAPVAVVRPGVAIVVQAVAADTESDDSRPSSEADAAASSEPTIPAPSAAKPTHGGRSAARDAPRQRRIVSIRGGLLLGQDGVEFKFKKKCPTCGYEDPCRSTGKIPAGTLRVPYYCRTCRKGRAVEVSGAG